MLAKIDGRTKESRLLAAARAELIRHVGGAPNSIQRTLIERAARLQLYLEVMDRETLETGTMSERASRQQRFDGSLRRPSIALFIFQTTIWGRTLATEARASLRPAPGNRKGGGNCAIGYELRKVERPLDEIIRTRT
jgi:hypothetical protein